MKPAIFTISKSIALEKFNEAQSISDIVSYSSKTNPQITPILEKNTKAMFSIHFKNELKHVKDKSRVIFLAQAWNDEEITDLLEQGVKHFVVDNETDLNTLTSYLKNNTLQEKIILSLRMKLKENTLKTERYYVFGITSERVNKHVQGINNDPELKEKIQALGIHFHRKTQNMAEWNLKYEIEDLLSEETLNTISYLNIGGGLPSFYANTNVNVLPSIFKKITEFKNFLNNSNIKLIVEPGRYIAAPAGELKARIIGIHDNTIILNASVYNSDLDAIIVPVKLKIKEEYKKEDMSPEEKEDETIKPYAIKGVTPCSMDLFRYRVYLKEPKVGDTITFINAGAYNFHTEFCDLDKIETIIVE